MDYFGKNEIESRQDFIKFLKTFRQDLEVNPEEWENIKLIDFLEAMERYTEDIQGFYKNSKQLDENADIASWKRFADILSGAKVYE